MVVGIDLTPDEIARLEIDELVRTRPDLVSRLFGASRDFSPRKPIEEMFRDQHPADTAEGIGRKRRRPLEEKDLDGVAVELFNFSMSLYEPIVSAEVVGSTALIPS